MQRLVELLSAERKSPKPALVFGPAHSGKKTRVGELLRARGYDVVLHSEVPAEARGRGLYGPLAHVVDANSLRQPKLVAPEAVLIYVCQDPYQLASQAELMSRFELVDLSKELRTLPAPVTVDQTDRGREAPWLALGALCRARDFTEKERLCEANANLAELLRNNALELGSTVQVDQLYSRLSDTDLMAHSMQADTRLALDILSSMQALSVQPSTRLRYGGWKPAPYVKRYQYSGGLWLPGALRPETKKKRKAEPKAGEAKKPRAAPKCRACGAPLKGHKTCPKKS